MPPATVYRVKDLKLGVLFPTRKLPVAALSLRQVPRATVTGSGVGLCKYSEANPPDSAHACSTPLPAWESGSEVTGVHWHRLAFLPPFPSLLVRPPAG